MADPLTIATFGSKAIKPISSLFGNNREAKRNSRDGIKSQILNLGVRRSAWNNFNSDSVKAGQDLLSFLQSNPGAVDLFNRSFNTDINRSNVDAFIAQATNKLMDRSPSLMQVSQVANQSFFSGKNIAYIAGALAVVGGLFWYQNK